MLNKIITKPKETSFLGLCFLSRSGEKQNFFDFTCTIIKSTPILICFGVSACKCQNYLQVRFTNNNNYNDDDDDDDI